MREVTDGNLGEQQGIDSRTDVGHPVCVRAAATFCDCAGASVYYSEGQNCC